MYVYYCKYYAFTQHKSSRWHFKEHFYWMQSMKTVVMWVCRTDLIYCGVISWLFWLIHWRCGIGILLACGSTSHLSTDYSSMVSPCFFFFCTVAGRWFLVNTWRIWKSIIPGLTLPCSPLHSLSSHVPLYPALFVPLCLPLTNHTHPCLPFCGQFTS